MERIMNLSKWTVSDVVAALARGGYTGENAIRTAKFAGVNDRHQAMFDIAYDDGDGIDYGRVFVFIDASGELIADY